jgi:hypothetical protein
MFRSSPSLASLIAAIRRVRALTPCRPTPRSEWQPPAQQGLSILAIIRSSHDSRPAIGILYVTTGRVDEQRG